MLKRIAHPMMPFAIDVLLVGIWIYFAILFGWLAANLLTGDRIGLVSLLNLVAVYLFLPLPLVILTNLYLRRPTIWAAVLVGVVAFLWLWGSLFLPRWEAPHTDPPDSGTLTVMTFNVLGRQSNTAPQVETLRQENADVVLIQELNHELAGAIQRQLRDLYPYQVLEPGYDVEGMGILSKYPLQAGGTRSAAGWDWPPPGDGDGMARPAGDAGQFPSDLHHGAVGVAAWVSRTSGGKPRQRLSCRLLNGRAR